MIVSCSYITSGVYICYFGLTVAQIVQSIVVFVVFGTGKVLLSEQRPLHNGYAVSNQKYKPMYKEPLAKPINQRSRTQEIIDLPQQIGRTLRHYAMLHSGFCSR